MSPLVTLTQIVYWLALSTWFGGVLFVAVMAPIIFRTVRDADPTLPRVLSVNLDGQHATLLAGSIVSNMLETLIKVQFIAAGCLGVALVGQWLVADTHWPGVLAPMVRSALYVAAVVLTLYDARSVWPKLRASRQRYIDHADEPEIANPARDEFDRQQRETERNLMLVCALLLALILLSANVAQTVIVFPVGGH